MGFKYVWFGSAIRPLLQSRSHIYLALKGCWKLILDFNELKMLWISREVVEIFGMAFLMSSTPLVSSMPIKVIFQNLLSIKHRNIYSTNLILLCNNCTLGNVFTADATQPSINEELILPISWTGGAGKKTFHDIHTCTCSFLLHIQILLYLRKIITLYYNWCLITMNWVLGSYRIISVMIRYVWYWVVVTPLLLIRWYWIVWLRGWAVEKNYLTCVINWRLLVHHISWTCWLVK